ncbi:hypothetical protein EDD80_10716 [Anseongella ginsenosidimutans]|uniref:Uncharacterized protein n=1 Tax=Anseongella ginsenosidimutans TaxID=496056 RepID=A0A4R3KQY0_9SPHI|nr:DsrE family protein [Anseongella ginsenosidimutans]QEC52568.1 hypothetical protein FRZ59_09620 [Anseongella ginsenosidimutans]TCS86483.1 hypothetical protein EDD80_10716 [Anseongella ginsenosidimutans]
MKKIKFLAILYLAGLLLLPRLVLSQDVSAQGPAPFTGARATLGSYKALYVVNSSDDKRVKAALRNIRNALNDPRLKGKLEVELIVFGDGVEIYRNGSPYRTALEGLKEKGVILAQCENTLNERGIRKSELYPFISFVPSGNGEIIIRQHQGWAIVYP